MPAQLTHVTVAAYPQDVQDASLRVALLNLRLLEASAQLAAARNVLRLRMETVPQWNEAQGIKAEITNNTKEQRAEIAEKVKAARAVAATWREQVEVETKAEEVAGIKSRISAELSGAAQMLMPFMRLL